MRNPTDASSHFTALRILARLCGERGGGSADEQRFTRVSDLLSHFDDSYGMGKDAEICLDILLQHRLIEANNRVDVYEDEQLNLQDDMKIAVLRPDSIKVTAYGVYFLQFLSRSFAYLELVCLDCGIRDEGVLSSLYTAANAELSMKDKMEKLESRLKRVHEFIKYLIGEEEREKELHVLHDSDPYFSKELEEYFTEEMRRVRSSAERWVRRGIDYTDIEDF